MSLQWGRNFIVAETWWNVGVSVALACASMGPQLYRCGNGRLERLHRAERHASMGPQLYRCGNMAIVAVLMLAIYMLQWGRNFIVAETSRGMTGPLALALCFNGAATLSLRKLGGNAVLGRHQGIASMGPQLYRCGNAGSAAATCMSETGFNGAATLSLRKLALIGLAFMHAS